MYLGGSLRPLAGPQRSNLLLLSPLRSTEAEVVAASEAAKEAMCLRAFLQELGEQDESPTQN